MLPIIHEILEADRTAPKRQRHTARRIFERLKAEYGHQGAKTVVEDAVPAWKQTHQKVFLPLTHPPGEAQVNFGEATIRQGGIKRTVALFVMTLPYSGAIFIQAFPRKCTQTFLKSHWLAFELFGGVPRRISDANSAIAVIEVLKGRERKLTKEFLRLQSHYLFQEHFCLVRTPNEKGHVERLIGFARRDFLVPARYAHRKVTVVATVHEVRLVFDDRLIAKHRRYWDRERTFFELIHDLALLERKPGGIDHATPLENWDLPECWSLLRRRLEAHDPLHGTRSFIQVLRLLGRFSPSHLNAAVEYALDIDVIDAASIRTIADHRADQPVELFPLDGRPHLAHVRVEMTDVSSYQARFDNQSLNTDSPFTEVTPWPRPTPKVPCV